MIPFDPVRNPFLQFQWLPCMNVGSTDITPYSLAIVTGVRCPLSDGNKSGSVTDDLNVVLEVVSLQTLSSLTKFEPAQLVFTGPTKMWPSTGGSYCAYGSCHAGDIGLLSTDASSGVYHLWPSIDGGLTTMKYPRLVLPLGSTGSASSSVQSLRLVRLVRDMPIEVYYSGAAATTTGVTGNNLTLAGSYTIAPDVSTGQNWFFTVGASTVTIKYDGYYEIGFGAKCEVQYESGSYLSVGLEARVGGLATGIKAECAIIGDDYTGMTIYDYPFISARGIYDCDTGQVVGLVASAAPTGRVTTFRDIYFYVRFLHGA